MKRYWGMALLVVAGLAFAAVAQGKTTHRAVKCRTGYASRLVRVPQRRHGRIVRRHGKFVYTTVKRCIKLKPKRAPHAPSAPVNRSGPPTTATAPPPPPDPRLPANTQLPAISGAATQGSKLTASTGTWTNSPTSYAYRWQDCTASGVCTNISGATSSTYTLQSSDIGDRVDTVVTASNAYGSTSAASTITSIVTGPSTSGDPVVAAAGDIACAPGESNQCQQLQTATLTASQHPNDVLVLGDNQYNSGLLSEYQGPGAYNDTWGVFNPMVHPVPGNHEYIASSSAAGYFSYFGAIAHPPEGYYSFNIGTWHIVALNSNCSGSGSCAGSVAGNTTSAQTAWLQSDLAANQSACVLAFWHHPLFSAGWTLGSPGVAPLWTALYNAHADVVLNGHDHVYERYGEQDPSGNGTANGIREFVVGTGGESLNPISNPASPNLEASAQAFGVLVLTLHAASYDWKFVTTNGRVADSGTNGCHSRASGSGAARDIGARLVLRGRTEPQLAFDARPRHSSLAAVVRRGLPVAIHCSRKCDVSVAVFLRRGGRARRIASFDESDVEIPQPYSRILLKLPARSLRTIRDATLVLQFAALDAAEHHRVVTRIVRLTRG